LLDQLTLQIISIAAIGAILILYAVFINRLRPSEDVSTDLRLPSGGNAFERPERPVTPEVTKSKERILEAATSTDQEICDETIEIENGTPEAESAKVKKRDKASKKAFFLFGKEEFKSCKHKFGHLKTLPKNTPIPDECFGCPQILECLMLKNNK